MTLGQEFATFARMTQEDEQRLTEVIPLLSEINLGGTAIGTGLNAPTGYAEAACRHLSELAGWQFVVATDMVEATQDTGVFVMLSGVLKRVAVKMSKVANDLRLLSSGPRAGLNEINLPPVQAGSSIMPGKVNPVIPEAVNQICYAAIGNFPLLIAYSMTYFAAATTYERRRSERGFEPSLAYLCANDSAFTQTIADLHHSVLQLTGWPAERPVSPAEMVEIFAVLQAAELSRSKQGTSVRLDEIAGTEEFRNP